MTIGGKHSIAGTRFATCVHRWVTVIAAGLLQLLAWPALAVAESPQPPLVLRAWGVPDENAIGPIRDCEREVLRAFRNKFPGIEPVGTTGMTIGDSNQTLDMMPMMQIAGDIAPDVLLVNFRSSETYIEMKLLYPLDEYLERLTGVTVADSPLMETEQYLARMRQATGWAQVDARVPQRLWPVIRRRCPYGSRCPYYKGATLHGDAPHYHVFMFPAGLIVLGMVYERPLFAEYADQGIEPRVPRDWEELLDWAKKLTDPKRNQYGLAIDLTNPGWYLLSFLYSAGGQVVEQDESGQWRCVINSDAGVEAAYFLARLRMEKTPGGYRGVLSNTMEFSGGSGRFGMQFRYLDERFLVSAHDQTKGFGPVPRGPDGKSGSELNASLCGIFSGLANERPRRDAAWEYIQFYDSMEARAIRTRKLVAAGLGEFVPAPLLRQLNEHGQYDDILRRIPPEWEEANRVALEAGVPEPYGKNCNSIYQELNKPVGAILRSQIVQDAIDAGRPDLGKAEIRRILDRATERINQRLLGHLTPEVQQRRGTIAWFVVVLIVLLFTLAFWKVIRLFGAQARASFGRPKEGQFKLKYLVLLPALGSIALWMYWPLIRGSVIAFQNYSVLGESQWTGADNFADVLFDPEFWQSMWLSLLYAAMFLLFGFWTPIALAFLLQEVPRGKLLFRTLYYLPAVLSGVVVIFLWRSFYAPEGLLNVLLNVLVKVCNLLPGIHLEPIYENWLDKPAAAMFLCLLPTIWAGVGPGCLIYLAALKTIPDEQYEAAEIDGAGLWRKVFSVSLPSISTLVAINLIGAIIGAIRGASGFILAMTGGGPYDESGGATEVIGLKLFFTTFGRLQFGVGAAMAWILGSMLIGLTILQLQRLSRIEFRAAGNN